MIRKIVEVAATILLVSVLVVIISGYVPEQVMFASYARSNSMEPTISVGDVFFIVPKFFAGTIDIGDIVVFRYPDSMIFIVHRVKDKTADGYITQGDNSPFSDQEGGYPYVKEEMIYGRILEFFGKPLLIPKLGYALQYFHFFITKNIIWIAAMLGAMGILFTKLDRPKRRIKRYRKPRLKLKHLYFASVFLLVSVIAFLMVSKTGVLEVSYLSSYYAQKNDLNAVLPNSIIEREIVLENSGYMPLYVILQPRSGDTHIQQRSQLLWPGSVTQISVLVRTSEEIGWHKELVGVCTYLPLLPPAVLEALSQLHPYVPMVIITSMLALAPAFIYKVVGGGDRPVITRRSWLLNLKYRLRGWLIS